jgi:hypothetical protein
MIKRSFRHWHKASRQYIIKITKQHMVVIVIIVVAAEKIVKQQKKEKNDPTIFSGTCSVMEV